MTYPKWQLFYHHIFTYKSESVRRFNSFITLSFASTKLPKIINILKPIVNRFFLENILKYFLICMFYMFKVTNLFVRISNEQSITLSFANTKLPKIINILKLIVTDFILKLV